jgi:hypothetical protein
MGHVAWVMPWLLYIHCGELKLAYYLITIRFIVVCARQLRAGCGWLTGMAVLPVLPVVVLHNRA